MAKRKSLQQTEDFYANSGYTGSKLRKALEENTEYQGLLKERKQKLTRQFKVTTREKEKYVLSTNTDFEILGKVKKLEKQKLAKEDKENIVIIKTQLERNWRKPLLKELNRLLKKYKQEKSKA